MLTKKKGPALSLYNGPIQASGPGHATPEAVRAALAKAKAAPKTGARHPKLQSSKGRTKK